MIREGMLSYAGSQSDWTSFEFENVALNTLVISVLATVFSYQAASIAHDLIFGFKTPGQANARNLHILLLTRQSSPLAIVSSILRQDWLTCKRFKDDMVKNEKTIARDEKRIRSYVIMKILFMIVLVPMMNILAIIASFGKSQSLTFRDVKFGGLALDVNINNSVQMRPHSRYCQIAMLSKGNNDYVNVTFSSCFRLYPANIWEVDLPQGWAYVSVSNVHNTSVFVWSQVSEYLRGAHKMAYVTRPGRRWTTLRSVLSLTSAEVLANKSIELLAKDCRAENFNVLTIIQEELMSVIKAIPCPISVHEGPAVVNKLIFRMLENITLVESDKFEVQPLQDQPSATDAFELADDYPFLVRRTRYVNVPSMAIITAVIVIIRALLKMLLNNDLGEGIHRILKKRVGLLCWDSMLRTETRTVSYFRVASGAES